jgi:uroporphyrinogen III methyltransferase/synthase
MNGAASTGKVFLVGAGPGDPGLLTVRARELIAQADVVMYDRLIPDGVLSGARDGALLEFSGKDHSGDAIKQSTIEQRMLEHARAGRSVVRLKGGDPLVFGRGGEEAAALAAAGVEFEIVPGVTAAVGASAYAGIPLTHRKHSAAVAFVTGHEDPERPAQALDWAALAAFPGTLAFYMTVKNLPSIAERLIAEGVDPATPAAVIAQGTTARQRTVSGRLDEIAAMAQAAKVRPPALTVIGSVVGEREAIKWFENRPLLGTRVALTATEGSRARMRARLSALGAEVIDLPVIETRALAGLELPALDGFDQLCFTSEAGVEAFFSALAREGRDARALAGLTVCAVGPSTAAALRACGIEPDLIPERHSAAGLLAQLGEVAGRRILLPRAQAALGELPDGLRELGATVTELAIYETVALDITAEQLESLRGADHVTFASGSAAEALIAAPGSVELLEHCSLVSIGPTTSEVLRRHKLEIAKEAETHDADGIVQALLDLADGDGKDR